MKALAKSPELREARAVAGQIRQGMRDYWKTLGLVKRAWDEEHWRTLGYESWEAYVDGEFGAERVGLPAEHRQKAVADLRLAGMPTRAIGTTLGVDQRTVRRDLAGAADAAPEELPAQVKGHDGKTYAAKSAHKQAGPEPLPGHAQDSPADPDSRSSRADGTAPGQPGASASTEDEGADARPATRRPAVDNGTRGQPGGEQSSVGVDGADGAGGTAAVETTPTADAPASGDHAVYPATAGGAAPGPAQAGPGVTPRRAAAELAGWARTLVEMDADGNVVPDVVLTLARCTAVLVGVTDWSSDQDVRTSIGNALQGVADRLHEIGASLTP